MSNLQYDINMTDGSGSLKGTGTWAGTTFTTDKQFSDKAGKPRARIHEALDVATERAFRAARQTRPN